MLSDVGNEADVILSRAPIFFYSSKHNSIGDMSITSWSARYMEKTFSQREMQNTRNIIETMTMSSRRGPPREVRGLSKADSQLVLKESGIFLSVGSGEIETNSFNIKYEVEFYTCIISGSEHLFSIPNYGVYPSSRFIELNLKNERCHPFTNLLPFIVFQGCAQNAEKCFVL